MRISYCNLSNEELVNLLIEEDRGAFSELYVRFKDRTTYFCLSLIKSQEQSKDIVQEIFLQIWESRFFLNPSLSFSSFIFTIAKNRCLNYLRKENIDIKAKELLRSQGENTYSENEFLQKEYEVILNEIIGKLPARRKQVFVLSRKDALSHKEIGERLDISVNTVQDHISKSIEYIKKELNEKYHLPLSLFIFLLMSCK